MGKKRAHKITKKYQCISLDTKTWKSGNIICDRGWHAVDTQLTCMKDSMAWYTCNFWLHAVDTKHSIAEIIIIGELRKHCLNELRNCVRGWRDTYTVLIIIKILNMRP